MITIQHVCQPNYAGDAFGSHGFSALQGWQNEPGATPPTTPHLWRHAASLALMDVNLPAVLAEYSQRSAWSTN